MLRFTGRTNAAIGRLISWLCAFDAKEALIEVAVKSWRSGVIEEITSSRASSAGGSSTLMIRVRANWAICTSNIFCMGIGTGGTVGAVGLTWCGVCARLTTFATSSAKS